MHILLIHQAFTTLNEPGGTRHHEMALFFAEKGHFVSIIASPISYLTGNQTQNIVEKDNISEKIRIYKSYTYSALHKSFIHRLISFFSFMVSSFFKGITIKNIDVVWGTTPPIFQGVTAWLISRIKRVPFILEVRDLWPDFAIAVGVLKKPLLMKLSYWLESFLYKNADQVVVNSPGFIEHVRKKGARRVSLIPNGSDVKLFNRQNIKSIRDKLGWKDKYIFLYAGAHGLSNDLEILLDTAKLLQNKNHIHFILIGDGKEKKNLMNLANQLNLKNLSFLDPVPKIRMSDFLFAADACIAILKPIEMYKTTYPNKVFDYMAARKPIVLAIDGVIREVIEAASCGIFCTPGDPNALKEGCLSLYNNQQKAALMGKKGYEYLKTHFDRGKIASDFLKLIEEMADSHG